MNRFNFPSIPRAVSIAFLVSILYWIYVGTISQTIIFHDSIGYERLGRILTTGGWGEYLRTGPNREPLYPFLISVSMRLAEVLSVSYMAVQKLIQLFILFLTQVLTLIILRKLKVNNFLTALTILYLGISPALLNAALRLYSEILTLPLVLLVVLFNLTAWEDLDHSSKDQIVFHGFAFALACLALTLTKGIFELITPFLLIPYFFRIKKRSWRAVSIFLLTFLFVFYVPLTTYKYANKKLNDHFALTDRGAYALYGNTARRMEPMSAVRVKTAFAYAVGHEFCVGAFSVEDCRFWHYTTSDSFGHKKRSQLQTQMSRAQADKTMIRLAIAKMFQNPFKQIFFMGVDTIKMFFWEFKSMAYVVYPGWLESLYNVRVINWGLSFLMAGLSLCAFLFSLNFIRRNKDHEATPLLSFTLLLLVLFIGLHSFFFVLPRYVFTITPLYLILMAFWGQRLCLGQFVKDF